MSNPIKASELPDYIDKETGVSEWFEVSQERINQFADATLDHQFIHIDEERAKPIFGSTIAHGFLSLSLLPHLASQSSLQIEGTTMGINYGLNYLRFLSPVPSGARVRVRSKLLNADEKKPGEFLLEVENTMEVEGSNRPAFIAKSLTLLHVAG